MWHKRTIKWVDFIILVLDGVIIVIGGLILIPIDQWDTVRPMVGGAFVGYGALIFIDHFITSYFDDSEERHSELMARLEENKQLLLALQEAQKQTSVTNQSNVEGKINVD